MNKNTALAIVISLVIVGGMVFFLSEKSNPPNNNNETILTKNVEIRDGIQYVTITAQGGYSPRVSKIDSDIPTKLVVKTNGTYDCSISLVIKSLGFQKILPPTGEEVIDLGIPKKGETVQGVCGMGMYNFQIES